jgi:hypothetical protein
MIGDTFVEADEDAVTEAVEQLREVGLFWSVEDFKLYLEVLRAAGGPRWRIGQHWRPTTGPMT